MSFVKSVNPNKGDEFPKSFTFTKFEKVINVMNKIKDKLLQFKVEESLIFDLNWVVENIINKSLFDIDFGAKKNDLQHISRKSNELQEYFKLIESYTQNTHKYFQTLREKEGEVNHSLLKGRRKRGNINTTKREKVDLAMLKYDIYNLNDDLTEDKLSKRVFNFHDQVTDDKRYKSSNLMIDMEDVTKPPPDSKKVNKVKSIFDKEHNEHTKTEFKLDIPKKTHFDFTFTDFPSDFNKENNNNNDVLSNFQRSITSKHNSYKNQNFNFGLHNVNNFNSIDFNIFAFTKEVGRENVAFLIFNNIVENLELNNFKELPIIDPETLRNFVSEIVKGYDKNLSYHNEIHAADVCETLYSWFNSVDLQKDFGISFLDLLAIYTSALVHDFKHPGFNNNYVLNAQLDIAITYNDKSVLENWHIAEAFKVLLKPKNNIFVKLSTNEFKDLRKRMIDAVLATDMSFHFKITSALKAKLDFVGVNEGENISKLVNKDTMYNDQQELINYFVHSADISHNAKEWKISEVWTKFVYEEFFNQGDIEKANGLPVSNFCDREITCIPKDQIGFISVIIAPNFDLLLRIFPHLKKLKENLSNNKETWEKKLNSK